MEKHNNEKLMLIYLCCYPLAFVASLLEIFLSDFTMDFILICSTCTATCKNGFSFKSGASIGDAMVNVWVKGQWSLGTRFPSCRSKSTSYILATVSKIGGRGGDSPLCLCHNGITYYCKSIF